MSQATYLRVRSPRIWGYNASEPGAVGAAPARGQHLSGGAVMAQRTPLHRFWCTVDRSDPSGCWIWPVLDRRTGYGRISVDGRYISTHRFAFLTFHGAIPESYVIDHLCRNRACCNPDHLEAVTTRENTLRGLASAITAARHASIKSCPKGHRYDSENTYVDAKGRRACRACGRLRSNKLTSVPLCRSCGKRNAGVCYPSSNDLEYRDGIAHRSYDGALLCLLPPSRKAWVG